jgi:hypothetical protein
MQLVKLLTLEVREYCWIPLVLAVVTLEITTEIANAFRGEETNVL